MKYLLYAAIFVLVFIPVRYGVWALRKHLSKRNSNGD